MEKQNTDILTAKDIQDQYGLERNAVYELLRRRDCPRLTGGRRKKYRISRGAFEKFIKAI